MEAITARSGIHVAHGRRGRGVFASGRIEAGEIAEICPILQLPRADVSGQLCDYIFSSADDDDTVLLLLGYGMLYNHSATPNVDYEEHDAGTIAFRAVRQLEAGDELTIDYGTEWWDDRGLTPD